MISLTVKTLDSQNHIFNVGEEITVQDFKVHIADIVNIPADTQRIIYCGRVLQDGTKLKEYDLNGKVVHLVQRAPPSQNPPTTRSSSPQSQRRGFRGFESGNTMYLGSMAFPSNLMESQGIVPPPPTHSLARSRLNVARRMLRRAEAVITLLEDPDARPTDQPIVEEHQEDEVTPIIEARVIVPPENNETIDEAMVLSAVQNSLFNAGTSSIPMSSDASSAAQGGAESSSPEHSASSSPEGASTPVNSGEPSTEEGGNGTAENGRHRSRTSRAFPANASRTTEMADLLNMLNQLQTRFAPFLERYRQFMVDDPSLSSGNRRKIEAMLTRVSEVMHFLGHAYHSLSDIIVRTRLPPPRALMCQPILIQHSAVVQAGIPIQVEVAQINLTANRANGPTNAPNAAGSATAASATTNNETSSTSTTTTTTASGQPASGQPTVNIRGFPFIPAGSMRVQSFPIEVRSSPVRIVTGLPNQNNNNNVGGTPQQPSQGGGTGAAPSAPTTQPSSGEAPPPGGPRDLGNSSLEFFMEVTPEVLQGTINGPPPEFLTSLLQMAGQIINRVATTTAPNTETTASSTSGQEGQNQNASGQNSQARGNTQTHPTTSTTTRSTSRPHVHLAQQAMQGGFDPFLPCNSHHVTHRPRAQVVRQQQTQQQQQQQPAGDGAPAAAPGADSERPNQNFLNWYDEIYSSLRTAYRRRRENDGSGPASAARGQAPGAGAGASAAAGGSGVNVGAAAGVQLPPGLVNFPSMQATLANLPNLLNGSTIADILNELPSDDETRPGESIITDLIMLLSRNFTLADIISLNAGNLEPLNRVTSAVRSFVNTRILEESTNPEAINRGMEKVLEEMQPFFENFRRLPVRDNIDMVRSVENLFRRRLPEILTTASNLTDHSVRPLVNQCTTLARVLSALALHASENGDAGVQETFRQMINSYLQGIPPELQSWTTMTSCANLRHFMGNFNISGSELEEYLIRNTDVPMAASPDQQKPPVASEPKTSTAVGPEPMDLDEPVATLSTANVALSSLSPLSVPGDESEPIPNIVLGAEPWHGQVPEDWVPIIARDVQRQRRQSPQAPFSDAYLSGMPTKRRKIVNSNKPQGSLPEVIAESVRRAVTTTGLTQAAPLETVCQNAGDSTEVQAAYRNLLRTTVQTALRDNEDFTPERFPNASTYFNKSQ